MQYARNNSARMMNLNVETQRMAQPITGYMRGNLSGETKPSSNPLYKGGAEWTGD